MRFDARNIRLVLQELGFPAGSVLVHTSAAMVLYGMLNEARDVDLAANETGWRHALTLASPRAASIDQVVEPLPGVEVFNGWLGESLDDLFARSNEVQGLLLAAPHDILEFKRRLDRPKDAPHIRLLEEFICNNH